MKTLVALLFLTTPLAAAFSAVSPRGRGGHLTSSAGTPEDDDPIQKLKFYQVLQRAGNTVFRPGGGAATRIMHEWADVFPGDTVLELASGLGTGGSALASKRCCNVILTDIDEERLDIASEMVNNKGLDDLVQICTLDMRKIPETLDDDDRFSAVVMEGGLSHQPDVMKAKILKDLLKHTDQILLHEMALRDVTDKQAEEVCHELGPALRIGFYPLTPDDWRHLLELSGYKITEMETGPMQVLKPKNLLRDEGPAGVAKIAWNLATNQDLRNRVRSTKKVIDANKDSLGYIILRAVKT